MARVPYLFISIPAFLVGCAAIPDVVHQPRLHNPFPQLHSVAVLPFVNQSDTDPTVDGDAVANHYITQLQQIPGFEVVPLGVAKQAIVQYRIALEGPSRLYRAELRRLGRLLNVDAVVVGSITDFSPYYPPRMGLAVDWYAVNPCFHPIPPGYGLPWGTPEEEYIPGPLVHEAEFALAREQLKTQTPRNPIDDRITEIGVQPIQNDVDVGVNSSLSLGSAIQFEGGLANSNLPTNWPDPSGFVPPPPTTYPPPCCPQDDPVISQVRQYNGNDANFTEALSQYFYLQDDARFGGWQAYLQRSDDFISFCCYLHISEMLAARGGAGETAVVWRWPIGRYER
jgi:hypothetical protein